MMRFDRFTEKAQEAAMRAYEILQHYKHTQVDTEHIFLALLQQSGGAVPQIMQSLQAPVPEMVQKLSDVLESMPRASNNPYGATATAQVFITPRLKRIMDIAYEEAMRMKDEYISTEHILLAVASERNTPSANILAIDSIATNESKASTAITPVLGVGYRFGDKYALELNAANVTVSTPKVSSKSGLSFELSFSVTF